jgi:predicted component of type VI protein secretion system
MQFQMSVQTRILLLHHLDDERFTPDLWRRISLLASIWRAIHSSTSVSIQPTALAPSDTGLGNFPSVTRW